MSYFPAYQVFSVLKTQTGFQIWEWRLCGAGTEPLVIKASWGKSGLNHLNPNSDYHPVHSQEADSGTSGAHSYGVRLFDCEGVNMHVKRSSET
jgi:hypothetical protein